MKIGFIGLGNMGAPMALNLAKASHQIIGYDISAEIPTKVIKNMSDGATTAAIKAPSILFS